MTWNTPKTWTPGEVVSAANLNEQLRDNMNHLLVRPLSQYATISDSIWQFTNTAPNFVPVALTSDLAITPMSGRVLLGCQIQAEASVDTDIGLQVNVDAGAASFFLSYRIRISTGNHRVQFLGPVPVIVDAGVQHTFRLEIAITGPPATVSIYNNAGGSRFRFWALEV